VKRAASRRRRPGCGPHGSRRAYARDEHAVDSCRGAPHHEGQRIACCEAFLALRHISSFSRGIIPPSFANCPSRKMRGRSAETALGCLRGTLWRTSHGGPQAFARRLESLAIGTLAARRSTRGICGLRPSERTLLSQRPNELTEPPRRDLQGHAQGHRIASCLS
jgi:hypothetical protein